MIRQLSRQCQMGGVVFGGDDQAAGVPVDAVNDAGTLLAADAGEGVPAVVQQGVDQRAVRMARRRMHHHALWLVYHNDALILIDDVYPRFSDLEVGVFLARLFKKLIVYVKAQHIALGKARVALCALAV